MIFNKQKKKKVESDFSQRYLADLWKKIGLKTKATIFTITVSTLPLIFIGVSIYSVTNQSLINEANRIQKADAVDYSQIVQNFLFSKQRELELLASTINDGSNVITAQKARLIQWQTTASYYQNVVVFNSNGDVVLQTNSATYTNQRDDDFFQKVLATNKPIISQPFTSENGQGMQIEMTVPVKDINTGKTNYLIRASIPLSALEEIIRQNNLSQNQYHLIDAYGKILSAQNKRLIGKDIKDIIADYQQLQDSHHILNRNLFNKNTRKMQSITYIPWRKQTNITNLDWKLLIATDTNFAVTTRQKLFWILALGTLITILLAVLVAIVIANRFIGRITTANTTLNKIAKGNLNSIMPLGGKDELTSLGSNINDMASQIEQLLFVQKKEAEERKQLLAETQALKNFSIHLSGAWNTEDIYSLAVQDIRQALKVDRVVIYKFKQDWQGTFIAESVVAGFPCAMGVNINEPCLVDYIDKYRRGKVEATPNIYEAGLSKCYIQQLETFAVRANLVAPIIVGGKLLGLLIAHQCSQPRNWTQSEIELFEQFSRLVGIALERANLLQSAEKARLKAEIISQEQRQQKEEIQLQLIKLLGQVEGAIQGDLTVHAEVNSGEIGTVADFFNAIVENLRIIVSQVKISATEMNGAIMNNSYAINQLAVKAGEQALEIERALTSVNQMRSGVKTVAKNARKTADIAHNAAKTAINSSVSIGNTVEKIVKLRTTIGDTGKKVKRLGETSQEITRVLYLINQISTQTNLLAINASMESTRTTGSELHNFALVAEEVAALSQRCTQATSEIETIIANIQRETSEVSKAMELGIVEVIEGARLVEHNKTSWQQILNICCEIDELIQSISTTTISQVKTSQYVTNIMKKVVTISENTRYTSQKIATSLQQTVKISEQLQAGVDIFKISN